MDDMELTETTRQDISRLVHQVYLDKMRTYDVYRLILSDNVELVVKLNSNRVLQFRVKLADRLSTFRCDMDVLKNVSEEDICNRLLAELESQFKV